MDRRNTRSGLPPIEERRQTGIEAHFFGLRTGTVSVTVDFGRRFASLGGTKRPVPASRVTFLGMCITSSNPVGPLRPGVGRPSIL